MPGCGPKPILVQPLTYSINSRKAAWGHFIFNHGIVTNIFAYIHTNLLSVRKVIQSFQSKSLEWKLGWQRPFICITLQINYLGNNWIKKKTTVSQEEIQELGNIRKFLSKHSCFALVDSNLSWQRFVCAYVCSQLWSRAVISGVGMVSHHSTEFVSVQKRWPLEGSMKSAFNAQESHAPTCLYGEFTGCIYWEQGWLLTTTVNLRFFWHFSIVIKLGVTAGWILSFWPPDQQTGCPTWKLIKKHASWALGNYNHQKHQPSIPGRCPWNTFYHCISCFKPLKPHVHFAGLLISKA